MGVTDVLRKAFPFISIAASVGGPVTTMAANALGAALKIDKVPATEDGIATTLANAMSDPDPAKRQAALEAEQSFQKTMAELGYDNEQAMESLAVQDRESARQREMTVRDYTPEIGFYLLVFVFWYTIHWLLKYPIPDNNRATVYSIIGSLATLVIMAATYFYGTTRGSETKTQAAIQTTNALVNKVSK